MSQPTFCWVCRKKLSLAKNGQPIFVLVKDPLGHEHRVHKVCQKDAKQ